MRLLLTFSYDGSKFKGFQRQNKERSVQKDIEDALKMIYHQDIEIKGAGRTDAGVHALGQCAHFDIYEHIPFLKNKLNNVLKNIKIKRVKEVSPEFHARFSAIEKVYEYKISFKENDDPNYYLFVKRDLDIDKMIQASKVFCGSHNFQNFVSGTRDNYETYINGIFFKKAKNRLVIEFVGMGFYRYMVRNLVGALLSVGEGKTEIKELKKMVDHPEIEKRLPTASPNGLYLKKIIYKNFLK